MPYRRPEPIPKAQHEKRHCSDLPTESRVPLGLHRQPGVLPTPPQADPPNDASYVDALNSSDPHKIRAALANIDAKTLLDQINKPEKPKWQTKIEDWISI